MIENDDYEEDDYLYNEDEWEDDDFPLNLKEQYAGYHLLKIVNFNGSTLDEVKAWLVENCTRGDFKQVGWYSSCAYSVGVVIQHPVDAMMFRLRWG